MGQGSFRDTPIEPERPLECSECRRPIEVLYTEANGIGVSHSVMCHECPVLQKKLEGGMEKETNHYIKQDSKYILKEMTHSCSSCGTTRDEILRGAQVGCPRCYTLFDAEIFDELVSLEKLPKKTVEKKTATTATNRIGLFHNGRRPYANGQEGEAGVELASLQKALHETVVREDFEQAAWLRDRIQQMTQKKPPIDTKRDSV